MNGSLRRGYITLNVGVKDVGYEFETLETGRWPIYCELREILVRHEDRVTDDGFR